MYVFSFSPNLFEFPANFSRAFCIVKKVNKNYLKNVKMFQFVVICSHKSLRTSGNKLVINLAFSNILMHTKSWIIIINGFAGGPVLGKWGCVSFGGFGTLAGLTEIWTITCIAYERHRAISTPLTKARKLSSFQVCK